MQETRFQSLGWEDPLEEDIAPHSSILAGKIPWAEEPGGLQSTGAQSQTRLSTHMRVHAHTHTHTHTEDIKYDLRIFKEFLTIKNGNEIP